MDLAELRALRDRLAKALELAEADPSPLPRLSAHDRTERKRLIAELDRDIERLPVDNPTAHSCV